MTLRGFFAKLQTTVTGGAILIAVASLVSRALGLVRDRLLFSTFGAGDVLDSYYVAFRLPDLIFNILILGALSSAFIPVFLQHRSENKEHWELASSIMNSVVVVLTALGVLAFIFAPHIVPLFAPGFDGDKLATSIELTRIMLIAIIFFGISNVLSSILNAVKRFFAFAFAPILYNVGIILGIVALYPWLGVRGLAWGVVLGAVLHLLIQIPSVTRLGFRYTTQFGWRLPGVRKVFKLMVPRMIGLSATQLEQVVSTMIASTLAAGSVAIFNAANNLQMVPINLFGVSLAISSFPIFSETLTRNRTDEFVHAFSSVFRRILFFIIPVSVLILLLRAHIVRLILGAGNFDWNATILTAQSLGFFSLSLFAQSLIPMLARSFYALQDTATPVKISIGAVAVNIIGSLLLAPHLGVVGIALSFAIASALHMLVLLMVLRMRLGDLDDVRILNSTIKIIVGSGVMALTVWIALQFLVLGIDQATFVGVLVQGAGAALAGLIVYSVWALVFRFEEVGIVRRWIIRAYQQLFDKKRAS